MRRIYISVASYSQADMSCHGNPLTDRVWVYIPILKKIKAICFTYKFEPIRFFVKCYYIYIKKNYFTQSCFLESDMPIVVCFEHTII